MFSNHLISGLMLAVTPSHVHLLPHRAGSRVIRIDPPQFLAGCRTRQLIQALSVLSRFLCVSVVLLTSGPFLHCVICVFCLLVVLVRLSVPVQVIDWKDSSPK